MGDECRMEQAWGITRSRSTGPSGLTHEHTMLEDKAKMAPPPKRAEFPMLGSPNLESLVATAVNEGVEGSRSMEMSRMWVVPHKPC